MANTKSRLGWREPRLYWHELPLGSPGFSGEPTPHQIRNVLSPLLEIAVFRCFHDATAVVVANLEQDGKLIKFEQFSIGRADDWREPGVAHLGVSIDRYATHLVYRLAVARWMEHWDQRLLKRLTRPRTLEGWLAKGTKGGVSLYLRRHRRWKGGHYLLQRG